MIVWVFSPPYVNHMDSDTWFDVVVKNEDRLKGKPLLIERSMRRDNVYMPVCYFGKYSFWLYFYFMADAAVLCF